MTSYIMGGMEGNLKTKTKQEKVRNRITIFVKKVNRGFLAYLGHIIFIR